MRGAPSPPLFSLVSNCQARVRSRYPSLAPLGLQKVCEREEKNKKMLAAISNKSGNASLGIVDSVKSIKNAGLNGSMSLFSNSAFGSLVTNARFSAATQQKNERFIPKALEAARAIPDEKTRAEALLKIVSLIDK